MGKKYHTVGTIPYVTLADFGYAVSTLWFYCSQNFEIFGFPIFWFLVYFIKVIPETRRAH
jgi:hypothetical protein